MNESAEVAVKTPVGTTQRETIRNIMMQGSVWGSLMCTATMDKLPQRLYDSGELLYK